MVIVIIHIIFSFLLDGFLSNYLNTSIVNPSYFITIYSLISLVIIFNYFDNKKKYLKILIVVSILFDIVYTNTLFLNIIIFMLIYGIIYIMNVYIPNNLFTINLKSLVIVLMYNVISYGVLLLVRYGGYPLNILWTILIGSIIMTIIYASISYIVINGIYFKIYDKKIR